MPKGKFLGADVAKIDLDALVRLLPGAGGSIFNVFRNQTRGRYILALLGSWETLDKEGINTPLRVGHFIAQGLVETGWLNFAEENLNYKAEQLKKTFAIYRNDPTLAQQHGGKKELIGNTAYGGRMGNDQPGDGYKYRGRGFFQITGKNNYKAFSEVSGVDLVANPDIIVKDLGMSVRVAAAFWRANNLSTYADQNNAAAVSRGINRGNPLDAAAANHEAERTLWTNKMLEMFKAPTGLIVDPNAPLSVGSTGERVVKLQTDLKALGYAFVGQADGKFGNNTKLAVMGVQDKAGLPKTGIADPATIKAIDDQLDDPRSSPSHNDRLEALRTYA